MSKKAEFIRAKLIVNPGAGKASEAANNLKLVTGYLKKNGVKVDVALARPKEKATPIARQAIKDRYKIVIAMGGDGTLEAVMRGMVGSKAHLGIIPAGIENNIAKNLGIPENLEEACALIASGNTRKLDVSQVKTRQGKKFSFFELATIGLSAVIYPAANKIASGRLSGAKVNALTLTHQEARPKVFVTLDDESEIEIETVLVMVSHTSAFGENLATAPDASLQGGFLDISVYPDFSKADLLCYLGQVMDGGYSGDGKVQHYQARKLKVRACPKLDVMADGIALGKGSVTIKVRPGALRVIATEKKSHPSDTQDAAEMLPAPVSPAAGKNHREKSATLVR